MIENAIIFSKETGNIILSSTFGDAITDKIDFSISMEKIKDIAIKLEKGMFILDIDEELLALILTSKRLAVALIFNQKLDKKMISEWEKVAREIINGFEKIYDPHNPDLHKYKTFKETMDGIIEWQLKEESPIDKMKEALW
ncbi:MAG: hypothetical protein FK731_10325 [Asgard group archaeon]|nr:hypothetical protein [Asgard group archaeon]